MGEDIEHRLAAAAQALREHELTGHRIAALREQARSTGEHLGRLLADATREARDVARLEGVSLTRLWVTLRGARDDALVRERAEAELAAYRAAEAEARLAAVHAELAAAQARLDGLGDAPGRFAAALDAMERHVRVSGDPRRTRLFHLAEQRGRWSAEARELTEATAAAAAARQALVTVRDRLNRAEGWSDYDTFLGGGLIASAIKRGRLDEAAIAAAEADRRLALLRTELADVPDTGLVAPQLAIGSLTRFLDVWFDNFFTDMSVRSRIRAAQRNVDDCLGMVAHLQDRLALRTADTGKALDRLATERRTLLLSRRL